MANWRRNKWAGRRVAVLLLLVSGASKRALAQVGPDALYAAASPAVVKLTIKDDDGRAIGTGSGFVIASEKLLESMSTSTVITNYHVIYPAVYIETAFQDKGTGGVNHVLVEDPSADIAVLEVLSSYRPVQVLKLCDSDTPAIGTKVLTIGSPLGLTNTLSEGLVSGYRERDDGSRWMQISAPISPGSSGGPVLSVDGCVLGITTATTKEGQNLNFAIPAKDVLRVLNAPKKDRGVSEGASCKLVEQFAEWEAGWRLLTLSGRSMKEAQDAYFAEGFCKSELLLRRVLEGDQLALMLSGHCLLDDKRYDDAVAVLKRAADAKPGEFAYLVQFSLGKALFKRGILRPFFFVNTGKPQGHPAYEEALPSWIKAKQLRPDFAPTREKLAEAYTLLGQYPEALLEAESMVSLLPRCYKGYSIRGTVWAALGRREAFERDFEKAMELRPNDAQVYNDKASGCRDLKDGNYEDCVDGYLKAISIDPDNILAHINLVGMYAGLGRCDKAFEHYKKAGLGELKADDSLSQQIMKCWARRSP